LAHRPYLASGEDRASQNNFFFFARSRSDRLCPIEWCSEASSGTKSAGSGLPLNQLGRERYGVILCLPLNLLDAGRGLAELMGVS
jgi:hypothetical protein